MISEFDRMPIGDAGAADFEAWCHRAIQVIFAVQLANIELHPNGSDVQRRDVVGRNLAQSPFWKRVREDYGVRQVIFEIKNYKDMGPDEYRQMTTYLTGEYGSAGFIVTREENEDLLSDRELPWMREMYTKQHKLVVKLTGTFLRRILSKLRSPQRHDEADLQLNKLFDRYTRNYLGEPTRGAKRRKKSISKPSARISECRKSFWLPALCAVKRQRSTAAVPAVAAPATNFSIPG